MVRNQPEELVEQVLMEMVLGLQPQMGVMVLWVTGETGIVQEKELAEAVVADTMAAAAAQLEDPGAGAAVAAEVAIRTHHAVALLFIHKVLKRLVSVLLYMEV